MSPAPPSPMIGQDAFNALVLFVPSGCCLGLHVYSNRLLAPGSSDLPLVQCCCYGVWPDCLWLSRKGCAPMPSTHARRRLPAWQGCLERLLRCDALLLQVQPYHTHASFQVLLARFVFSSQRMTCYGKWLARVNYMMHPARSSHALILILA